MTRERLPLWRCPKCGEQFTTRHQWHSCGSFDIEDLFASCDKEVRRLYERFLEIVQECGPVKVIPQKSRIVFQVRMRFAAVMPQKKSLRGHVILAHRQDASCFHKVETFSPRNHLHAFRLESEEDLGRDLRHWVCEAYKVGCQDHIHDGAARTV
ncbi:MAG: DUF5655 domain-containing protein [Acidobacteriota bacterium]